MRKASVLAMVAAFLGVAALNVAILVLLGAPAQRTAVIAQP